MGAFLRYPCILLHHSGLDWPTVMSRLESSKKAIAEYFSITSTSSECILDKLLHFSHDIEFLYNIPRPVSIDHCISPDDERQSHLQPKVLDIMKIKIEGMKSALSFVHFTLRSKKLVL